MCVPKLQEPAAQPTLVPSMQSASAFQPGGDSRGAAQIGRLQLRLGGTTSLNPGGGTTNSATPPAVTPATPAVTPTGAAQVAAAGGNPALPFAAGSWLPPATAFTRVQGFGPSGRL